MSLSKSESARINGSKSRGPKTPAGKAKSSQNAIKHGIFAQVIVLRNENADLFEELTQDYVRRFEPRDEVELAIVEQMIAATWRLSRCWSMQAQTMNLEMDRDQDDDNGIHTKNTIWRSARKVSRARLHRFTRCCRATGKAAIPAWGNASYCPSKV
jgi:hypothetical protein